MESRTSATFSVKRHYRGCYRVSNGSDRFGQIKRDGREWHAEIRDSESGSLIRVAGIWRTRSDAIDEVEFILSRIASLQRSCRAMQ
jgi:hypothetical protein